MTESQLTSSEKLPPEKVQPDYVAPSFRIVHLFLFMVGIAIFLMVEDTSIRMANRIVMPVAENETFEFSNTTFSWADSALRYGVALGLAGCWVFTYFVLHRKFKWQPGHGLIPIAVSMFLSLVMGRLAFAYSYAQSNLEDGVLYAYIPWLIGTAMLAGAGIFVFWRQRLWRIYFILYSASWIMLTAHFVFWISLGGFDLLFDTPSTLVAFDILNVCFNGSALALLLIAVVFDIKRKEKRDWMHYVSCIHAAVFLHAFFIFEYVARIFGDALR